MKQAERLASAVPEPVRPSSSTTAALVGGAIATLAAFILELFIDDPIPAPVVSSLTTLATAGVGYFFYGGRSRETI